MNWIFNIVFAGALCLTVTLPAQAKQNASIADAPVVMAVHGGAGSIEEVDMTAEEEEAYRAKLTEALEAGYAVIQEGGSSTDAVVAALTILETSPLFNAGRGAVFTSKGTVTHDASIMEGENNLAGAVAGVMHIKHPIKAARLVMQESRHVLLAGDGAEEFALLHGLEFVSNSYFYTEERKARFLMNKAEGVLTSEGPGAEEEPPEHLGTVGAIVVDQSGTLAAGTSTGGMSNKRWGRIGDSPIIGAGTYADNETAAISSTGWGEYFIRGAIAHDIAAMMRYTDASVREAARTVVLEHLPKIGDGRGSGGVIALDAEGNLVMPFTTPGMFRGWITEDGDVTIRFYGMEE